MRTFFYLFFQKKGFTYRLHRIHSGLFNRLLFDDTLLVLNSLFFEFLFLEGKRKTQFATFSFLLEGNKNEMN